MKLEEIKAIAQQYGIKVGKMKKSELVRAIQSAEGNMQCFETGNVATCGQTGCRWFGICS
ncbi:MAG: Rho termination factor N-terminal domain-containing protein [Desulfuromonadaceae bacterium]|nr:Rho termination factor N-terminal domain-containing protein [Desulfuromonadaceae bacterium]MDD5105271.1 Rho termination factor N-terminal domain-containing protein [Desulfuromonadaceae bacterium]